MTVSRLWMREEPLPMCERAPCARLAMLSSTAPPPAASFCRCTANRSTASHGRRARSNPMRNFENRHWNAYTPIIGVPHTRGDEPHQRCGEIPRSAHRVAAAQQAGERREQRNERGFHAGDPTKAWAQKLNGFNTYEFSGRDSVSASHAPEPPHPGIQTAGPTFYAQ